MVAAKNLTPLPNLCGCNLFKDFLLFSQDRSFMPLNHLLVSDDVQDLGPASELMDLSLSAAFSAIKSSMLPVTRSRHCVSVIVTSSVDRIPCPLIGIAS